MLVSAKKLMNYSLLATDGLIGDVIDIYFAGNEWLIRYLAADIGRWLPGRHILVSTVSILTPKHDSRELPVNLNREQVRRSPGIDLGRTVSRRYERDLHHHYRWPVYWEHSTIPVTNSEPGRAPEEQREEREQIRSGHDLIGNRITALDYNIGHVDDILLDDAEWRIRYLVAGTRNILTVKETLLDVTMGMKVDWDEELITVDFARDVVRNAPPFVSAEEIDAEYEAALAEYYSQISSQ